jgi:hypothetical protein
MREFLIEDDLDLQAKLRDWGVPHKEESREEIMARYPWSWPRGVMPMDSNRIKKILQESISKTTEHFLWLVRMGLVPDEDLKPVAEVYLARQEMNKKCTDQQHQS